MFPHAVMKNWHPMLGIDLHIQTLPPPAPPVPMVPYKTVMLLSGTIGWFLTAKYCPTHYSAGWGFTMARGTDIGPLIPHVGPPSITLTIEMVFSASKSHFGPRSYVERDNNGDNNHIAAALGGFINPNLNCGTPCPTPTGFVLALNTHGVGMTMGDITAGFAQMTIDTVVQTILFHAGNAVGSQLGRVAGRFGPQAMTRAASRAAFKGSGIGAAARQLRADQLAKVNKWNSGVGRGLGVLINIFAGGPTGADADAVGGPTAFGLVSKYVNSGGDTYTDYMNGGPPVINPGSAPIVPMF